jgi:hypothetical protein
MPYWIGNNRNTHDREAAMKSSKIARYLIGSMLCLAPIALAGVGEGTSQAAPVAKMAPDGSGLELEYLGASGTGGKEVIPVHHAGNIKYFSAGVGQEERTVQYPPFPLKVIFVAGPKAYLSEVTVTITDTAGKLHLQIPGDQVAGPWLFVDLPPGTYELAAVGPGHAQVKERVTITKGHATTVYLRWKKETMDHKEAGRTS